MHAEFAIVEEEPAVKGWNWGDVRFTGSSLAFMVEDKPAFEINLNVVSNATAQKNEALLEFHKVRLGACACVCTCASICV